MAGDGALGISNPYLVVSVVEIGALLLTALTIFRNAEELRAENELAVAQAHRELWLELARDPNLHRVLDPNARPDEDPPTTVEREFLSLVFVHAATAYRLWKRRVFRRSGQVVEDIQDFLRLPLPRQVWSERKPFLDADFVDYVERLLDADATGSAVRTVGKDER